MSKGLEKTLVVPSTCGIPVVFDEGEPRVEGSILW